MSVRPRTGRVDDDVLAAWVARLKDVRSDASDVSPELKETLAAFRQAMWLGLGIVRTADGLEQARAEAAAMGVRVARLPQETLGALIAAVELEHLAAVGTACAASALLRTESRAAHYRDDFPSLGAAKLHSYVRKDQPISLR